MNYRHFSSFIVLLFLAIGCQETGKHEEKIEGTLVKDQAPRSVETATVTSNPLPVPEFTPTPIPSVAPVVVHVPAPTPIPTSTPAIVVLTEEEKFLQKLARELGTNDFYHFREQLFKGLIDSSDLEVKKQFSQKYFAAFEFQIANLADFTPESTQATYYEKMKNDALTQFFQNLTLLVDKEKEICGQSSDEKMKSLYAFIASLEATPMGESRTSKITMLSLLREELPRLQNYDKELLVYALKIRFKYFTASVLEQVSNWEKLSHSERGRMQYFYWTPDYLKKPSEYSSQLIRWNELLLKASDTKAMLDELHEAVDLDKKVTRAFQNMRRKEGRLEQNLSDFYKNLDNLLPKNN